MVGLLGNIRFRVSEGHVLTFQKLKKEISSNWNTADRIGLKPLVEYGGPQLQKVSLEIVLDASLGVRPSRQLKQLERMTEAPQAYDVVLRGGEIYRATVSLSLQEYV